VIDTDMTKKGVIREINLMADRSQAATAFYKFVQYTIKILQKCTILFFDTLFKTQLWIRPQQYRNGSRKNKIKTKL
jgi:hypothetical protein